MRRKTLIGLAALSTTVAIAAAALHNAGGSSPAVPASVNGSNAFVSKEVDGDTIHVSLKGKDEKVRFIGIDTPETVDPDKPVGCFGKEASDFTKSLLPVHTPVRLVLDAEHRDKYGRLLAYVYRSSDNLFVNAELARQGYAVVLTIPPNVAHVDEFVALASQARQNNVGLWSKCQAVTKTG